MTCRERLVQGVPNDRAGLRKELYPRRKIEGRHPLVPLVCLRGVYGDDHEGRDPKHEDHVKSTGVAIPVVALVVVAGGAHHGRVEAGGNRPRLRHAYCAAATVDWVPQDEHGPESAVKQRAAVAAIEEEPRHLAVEDPDGGVVDSGDEAVYAVDEVVVEDADEGRGVAVVCSEAAEELRIGDEAAPCRAGFRDD